ncbi:MAG: hypothetical protein MZU91_02905 [Desulfosudis oleivorans]|nr:hypothetical protein [Desulfosudis oleivorans]
MKGYYRQDQGDQPRSSGTGGSTPVTSDTWTRTATSIITGYKKDMVITSGFNVYTTRGGQCAEFHARAYGIPPLSASPTS